MTSHILVLGATGKIGRRTVARLRAAGHPVVAASRSSPQYFDWHKPDTWDSALDGADRVFVIPPERHANVAEFAQRAAAKGVRRLVALSGRKMDQIADALPATGMLAADQAVRESGVEWTVLQPNNFHQNFDEGYLADEIKTGTVTVPMGEVGEPFIDADDVAAVAATVLTTTGHAGQVYELTGPESLPFSEAAAIISRVTGRQVIYQSPEPSEYVAGLRAAGVPEDDAEFLSKMYAHMRTGAIAEPTSGVRRVLDREPISFADFAVKAVSSGAWDATPDPVAGTRQ